MFNTNMRYVHAQQTFGHLFVTVYVCELKREREREKDKLLIPPPKKEKKKNNIQR